MTDDQTTGSGKRGWRVERALLLVVIALQCVILWRVGWRGERTEAPGKALTTSSAGNEETRTTAHAEPQSPPEFRQTMVRTGHGARERVPSVFQEMDALFEQVITDFERLDRLFDTGKGWERIAASPWLDMNEDEECYMVNVSLPGARPSDVEVALEGRLLTIRGVIPAHRHPGLPPRGVPVERRVMLPGPVAEDRPAEAAYTNGTLRVVIPKALVAGREFTPR